MHPKSSAQYGHTLSSTQLPLVKASYTAKSKSVGLGCVFCPQSAEGKYLLSTNAVYHNDLSDDLLHTKEIDMRFFGSLQECVVMSRHMANPNSKVSPCSLLPFSWFVCYVVTNPSFLHSFYHPSLVPGRNGIGEMSQTVSDLGFLTAPMQEIA